MRGADVAVESALGPGNVLERMCDCGGQLPTKWNHPAASKFIPGFSSLFWVSGCTSKTLRAKQETDNLTALVGGAGQETQGPRNWIHQLSAPSSRSSPYHSSPLFQLYTDML